LTRPAHAYDQVAPQAMACGPVPVRSWEASSAKVTSQTGAGRGDRPVPAEEVGTAAQGAAVVVRLATLGADGPTGGFFSEDGPIPW
jgi:hypothetical protein